MLHFSQILETGSEFENATSSEKGSQFVQQLMRWDGQGIKVICYLRPFFSKNRLKM